MKYCTRKWLNPDGSPSTGNVVCFDGVCKDWDGDEWHNTFISISDCHNSARLHKAAGDTKEDFIFKLTTLRDEIDKFISYLENK